MFIYKLTNKINGKIYVGQTSKTILKRWKDHIFIAKGGKQKYPAFSAIHAAIVKYGEENFDIQEIDTASNLDELNEKEMYWIAQFKKISKLYNLNNGGGGNTGHIVSDSTRQKLSITKSGTNNSFYGKKHSLETLQKYSEERSGATHTIDTKKKMSENQAGRIINEGIATDIINRLKNGQSMASISKELNIGYSIVNGIKRNKNWKHLPR